ncbi:MAG: hypothetical protein Ct9H300mP14_03130 [Gammaproteobacteria bacterium]|nr:MAG: hypothetical protein Ct9H300mP14_03130 [Gammaproteobacteria bacterium]
MYSKRVLGRANGRVPLSQGADQIAGPGRTRRAWCRSAEGFSLADSVKDFVCIFARTKNPLVAHNRKVLGDVTLGGADHLNRVLDTDFLGSGQYAENFKA